MGRVEKNFIWKNNLKSQQNFNLRNDFAKFEFTLWIIENKIVQKRKKSSVLPTLHIFLLLFLRKINFGNSEPQKLPHFLNINFDSSWQHWEKKKSSIRKILNKKSWTIALDHVSAKVLTEDKLAKERVGQCCQI